MQLLSRRMAAAVFMMALLSSCAPSVRNDDDIRLGFIGPLTGEAATFGIDALYGAQMAVDRRNAAGGIDGKMVHLFVEDGRCNGQDAAAAASKLIRVNDVAGIIGGECSGETLAAAPVAEKAGVVMLSPTSSSPEVSKAGDFIFRDYPSDALKTKAMAAFFAEQKYKRVAIISEHTDFAIAFRDALKRSLPDDALVFDETVEPGTKDFRALMLRLNDESFDVFVPNAQTDAVIAAMMKELRAQKFKQPAVSHDSADSALLAQQAPAAVEGMYIISVPAAGAGGDFEKSFIMKFGKPQGTIAFAAHAYDAANLLMDAIDEAGTSGEMIRDYLYHLPSYEGVVGTIRFDENGDVVGIPYMLKVFQKGVITDVRKIAVE